ncbi:hypothetical protein CH274_22050 [Rhodococcus sp. 06-418-5]|jgi:4-carboxymuconolactone decarboxylase|uniref:carboxymuconolactone decarboxylase family protein n=1 Tax=Rhodococcus sp. 06-418-5 TaxID=2022507 RepID=UPI000B9AFCE0|nr:carboxymuconolactone decarboxylase family protein [Rhodococcus sp. 06-418-5]OZC74693.1 hypothetical protein CH274_22050 [Rhodococcus sp. 06-418-5]
MDENTAGPEPVTPTDLGCELGGRLRLLAPEQLTNPQRELHDRLTASRVSRGNSNGYRASLEDGRLIGPFNAMLRIPDIAGPQLDWVESISSGRLPAAVREVAILTVATEWNAAYILYAHRISARVAGVSERTVAELTAQRTPHGWPVEERLAHQLALALVHDHDVPDELYAELVGFFGEQRLVELVELVGQYLTTSAITTCFRVPAPNDHT